MLIKMEVVLQMFYALELKKGLIALSSIIFFHRTVFSIMLCLVQRAARCREETNLKS